MITDFANVDVQEGEIAGIWMDFCCLKFSVVGENEHQSIKGFWIKFPSE